MYEVFRCFILVWMYVKLHIIFLLHYIHIADKCLIYCIYILIIYYNLFIRYKGGIIEIVFYATFL